MAASARTQSKLALSSEVPRRREVLGVLLLGLTLFLGLSLVSFQVGNRSWTGPFGHFSAVVVYGACGLVGYLVVAAVGRAGLRVLAGEHAMQGPWEWVGLCGGFPALAILLYLLGSLPRVEGFSAGGLIGEYGGAVLRAAVGTVGAVLIASLGLVLGMLAATPVRMSWIVLWARRGATATKQGAREGIRLLGRAAIAIFPGGAEEEEEEEEEEHVEPVHEPDDAHVDRQEKRGARRKAKAAPEAVPDEVPAADTERVDTPMLLLTGPEPPPTPGDLPVIVESRFKKQPPPPPGAARPEFIMTGTGSFQLPALDLLEYQEGGAQSLDRQVMHDIAIRLHQTLETYGVRGKVTEIHPGPVVTMYEFVPEPGTRIAKISGLADELAMTLEAMRVRIVAPIPGKNAVGIEVPNPSRETVYLKEILADDGFARARSKLTLALGKDIAGRPVVVDLGKMPHLLVAGTTGSGKSVSVNSMICSLLYGASPEEVRLIMVDPKMLELSVYEGVPHLLLPVVTDPKKANLALRWAVEEMERRYELLAAAGVRDLAGYNRKVEKLQEGRAAQVVESVDVQVEGPEGAETLAVPAEVTPEGTAPQKKPGRLPDDARKLPYIVVIIDEFADLMMVASKEVETSVARIAQKARAAGIHLLLATQRPSVDVITGLIKANFPSRIAFQVSSKVDSRTILDQGGAEALLGQGDMLFSDRGGALRRVHGCLVTDGEIGRVVEFLKGQGQPVYDMDILRPRDEDGGDGGSGGAGDGEIDDGLYDQAIRIVAETRQASISMLQRRLRVGYNRAARMIERMEKEGIVGPADGPNRREVLISPQ